MTMNRLTLRHILSLTLATVIALAGGVSLAQDVELFGGANPAATTLPNVLIVVDNTSNWNATLTNGQSAWDPELVALSNTVQALAASGAGNRLRVGLMMFTGSGANGGYVRYSIRQMTSNNAAQLSQLATTLRAILFSPGNSESSNNPTYAQTMNEAYLYFFGKTPRAGFGDSRRDCGSDNTNSNVPNPQPGYDLRSLGNYGYTSCGSGNPNKKNEFEGPTNNVGVSYVAPPDVSALCQRNFIVFISNGPTANNDSGPGLALLQAAVAAEGAAPTYAQVIPVTPSGESGSSWADEWARFLNEVKNVTTYTINVKTTTGQSANHDALMSSMGTNGGGDNCNATDPASIQECLTGAFNNILAKDSVFASVTLPVSVNPQLQNLDQVYMGMFRPDAQGNPRWFGNLKQYRLALDINKNPYLADSVGNPGNAAVDTTDGTIKATAISYWTTPSTYWSYSPRGGTPPSVSDSPDGPLVEKGGAAERLRTVYAASGTTSNVANRKVFTCVGCSSKTALAGGTDTSTGATSFSSANSASLASALRVSAAEAPGLIKWVRGENTDPPLEKTDGLAVEARPSIHGDVLHSSPTVLTVTDTELYIFYGANDGMIHAIKGGRVANVGGNEIWSFLPEEFLPRMNRLRQNSPVTWSFDTISTSIVLTSGSATASVGSTAIANLTLGMFLEGTSQIPHYTYITGIDTASNQVTLSRPAFGAFSGSARFVPEAKPMFADGALTLYKDPTDNKTYLFAAMRRGGRFLYAFDVTDPVNPLFLWRRGCDHAGITTNNGYGCDPGYDDGAGHALGQTWSAPRVARVGTLATNQTVLIFGAGYDPTVEDPDPALTSGRTMGQGVFVVDAHTGDFVARIRPTNMDFAVPSDITLIDFDGNGLVDRLYFGDTGGQVWRVDTNSNANPAMWSTQRIASLGLGADSGFSAAADGRKFLFPPDVVETAPGTGIYAILLSSGDRENPLNGAAGRNAAPVVVNRIYMLKDGAPRGTTVIAETDLDDRTTNKTLVDKLGWFIRLTNSGEKGTGSIVTLAGTSYIGTNYPVAPDPNVCSNTVGNARFYTVDFLTSAGRGSGSSPTDIALGRHGGDLVGGGMPPSPVGTITLTPPNTFVQAVLMGPTVLPVGPAKVGDRFRNYWYKLFGK